MVKSGDIGCSSPPSGGNCRRHGGAVLRADGAELGFACGVTLGDVGAAAGLKEKSVATGDTTPGSCRTGGGLRERVGIFFATAFGFGINTGRR